MDEKRAGWKDGASLTLSSSKPASSIAAFQVHFQLNSYSVALVKNPGTRKKAGTLAVAVYRANLFEARNFAQMQKSNSKKEPKQTSFGLSADHCVRPGFLDEKMDLVHLHGLAKDKDLTSVSLVVKGFSAEGSAAYSRARVASSEAADWIWFSLPRFFLWEKGFCKGTYRASFLALHR